MRRTSLTALLLLTVLAVTPGCSGGKDVAREDTAGPDVVAEDSSLESQTQPGDVEFVDWKTLDDSTEGELLDDGVDPDLLDETLEEHLSQETASDSSAEVHPTDVLTDVVEDVMSDQQSQELAEDILADEDSGELPTDVLADLIPGDSNEEVAGDLLGEDAAEDLTPDIPCGGVECNGECCLEGQVCDLSGHCVSPCAPDCVGRICGPDGCGGTCGNCAEGQFCDESGHCLFVCTADCTGRVCGDDGCGGTCGTCPGGQFCDLSGHCVTSCTPDCTGRVCGNDGCGGSCGNCPIDQACDPSGHCVSGCTPDCLGKQCGPDGCGANCGVCPFGFECLDGSCEPPDTCGNGLCDSFPVPEDCLTCPEDCPCLEGQVCWGGICCVHTTCESEGWDCGTQPDGCGGQVFCGVCDPGESCVDGTCSCVPSCSGKECGDDGCGGSCGSCDGGTDCNAAGLCQTLGCDEVACQALGQHCDEWLEQCVECVNPWHCALPDQTCKASQCVEVQSCTTGSDCDAGVCWPQQGYCVECLTDWDCGESGICLEWECHFSSPCESDAGCGSGRCHWSGVCVQCLSTSDCPTGELCDARWTCVPGQPCESNDDCASMGMLCSGTHFCVECFDDPDCPENYYCQDWECRPDQCVAGSNACTVYPAYEYTCYSNGRGWGNDTPCATGDVCGPEGVCIPWVCESDPGCTQAGLLQCSEDFSGYETCEEIQPGCFQWSQQTDCMDGGHCQDGQCVPPCWKCSAFNHEICVDGFCVCDEANGWFQGGDSKTCVQQGCEVLGCNPEQGEFCNLGSCLQFNDVTEWNPTVRLFELQQIVFPFFQSYSNPYDPDVVDIEFVFTAPSGAETTTWAFAYRDYSLDCDGPCEGSNMEALSDPVWMVRFAPTEIGTTAFTSIIADADGPRPGPSGTFQVVDGPTRGYVEVAPSPEGYWFRHSTGEAYYAVGMNTGWGELAYGSNEGNYDMLFPEMHDAGCNWARVWMIEWAFGIEVDEVLTYRLGAAYLLDHVLEVARRNDIRVVVTLDNYSSVDGGFDAFPYSEALGGPCATPRDFWTHEDARSTYRHRLRYLVSRWGWSPHVFSWEFWNEINLISDANDPEVQQEIVDWHADMAAYLKSLDPKHMVTTSTATPDTPDYWEGHELFASESVDYTQTHSYALPDETAVIASYSDAARLAVGKPHFMEEFGVNGTSGSASYTHDKNAFGFHNGLWASLGSLNAGTSMSWWWNTYVHYRDLYFHMAAFKRFIEGIPWEDYAWSPASITYMASGYEVTGLTATDASWLWVRHNLNKWCCPERAKNYQPGAISTHFSVNGLPEGNYLVEWWDTRTGFVEYTETVTAAGEGVELVRGSLRLDWAVKVQRDSDSDGMPDWWETKFGLNPAADDAVSDHDADGLANLVEYGVMTRPDSGDTDRDGLSDLDEVETYLTLPLEPDTDGDGMADGWEVEHSLNPLDPSDGDLDGDLDGILNRDEYLLVTQP